MLRDYMEGTFCGLPFITEITTGIFGGWVSGVVTVYCAVYIAPSKKRGASRVAAAIVTVFLGIIIIAAIMFGFIIENSGLLTEFSDWLNILILLCMIVGAWIGVTVVDEETSELVDK